MTNIDNTTGLPALPEGQIWRVTRDSKTLRSGWYGQAYRHNEGKLQIIEQVITTRRGIFKPLSRVDETVRHESWIEALVTLDYENDIQSIYAYPSYDYSLNAETILRTANEMIENIEAQRRKDHADKIAREQAARAAKAEEKRIAALLGDYPPRRLAVTK